MRLPAVQPRELLRCDSDSPYFLPKILRRESTPNSNRVQQKSRSAQWTRPNVKESPQSCDCAYSDDCHLKE
jgi:hypothetical protein